jgi:hypothetical protein
MATVDVAGFQDTFVLHFGGDLRRVNAYTLASALIGLSDAARAANAAINPGYNLEVVVESLGPGSFKATVRAIYSGARNLFSGDAARQIVWGIIAAYIFQHTLSKDQAPVVVVNTDEVIIEHGDTRIVVPRDVHEGASQMERNSTFRRGLGGAFRALESDPEIRSLSLASNDRAPALPLEVPRDRFALLSTDLALGDPNERELEEIADLQIIRAILVRSARRWQFIWNGIRISAPVSDAQFYSDFAQHRIRIAPGDVLRARLRIRQVRDARLGAFVNVGYEVVEVLEHIAQTGQSRLPLGPSAGF